MAPMTPEEYARFMGHGDDDEETTSGQTQENTGLEQNEVDRIRTGLKQTGVSESNIQDVMKNIHTLKKGEQREFNFIRGHVRRVRIRRETSGKVTLITY